MRKVMYFKGGVLAEFNVPDAIFTRFSDVLDGERRYADAELEKAQKVLDAFVARGDETASAGGDELAAACFVWNFFNTNPDPDRVIDDDVFVIDLNGDGDTIQYAALGDIPSASDG